MNAGRCWRGKHCFASRGEQIISKEGTQKQLHFWISLAFSLVGKYHTRFIKKDRDTRSCHCKNFSLKVVGVRSVRGVPDPPEPPPGSATETLEKERVHVFNIVGGGGRDWTSVDKFVWRLWKSAKNVNLSQDFCPWLSEFQLRNKMSFFSGFSHSKCVFSRICE